MVGSDCTDIVQLSVLYWLKVKQGPTGAARDCLDGFISRLYCFCILFPSLCERAQYSWNTVSRPKTTNQSKFAFMSDIVRQLTDEITSFHIWPCVYWTNFCSAFCRQFLQVTKVVQSFSRMHIIDVRQCSILNMHAT